MPNITSLALANKFSTLFSDPLARRKLARFATAGHTLPPTFNLTTTSLRHLPKWFDRLEEIQGGTVGAHGNFFSDPASIGLVDNSVRPQVLTPAGLNFLSKKASLYSDTARAEYELIKTLYFKNYQHSIDVQSFLTQKHDHMLAVLKQFRPVPSRELFVSYPSLLVVAELVASFPGAISELLNLSQTDLVALATLGENGLNALCNRPHFPTGLKRLARRIASNFTRGEERRLHYVASMALLTIAASIPLGSAIKLQVPPPFSNLFTEMDIYKLHARYTSDINVWFDGVDFRVGGALLIPAAPVAVPPSPLRVLSLQAQTGIPAGTSSASATDPTRRRRRGAKQQQITVIVDQFLSERSEDFVENTVLVPQYGSNLIRVGHRSGEMMSLSDGMVPGADFYAVTANGNPCEFIEIKSISGNPPANIALTRAEYLRARQCAATGISYRLILVDIASGKWWEVGNFAQSIVAATLDTVLQFVVRVG